MQIKKTGSNIIKAPDILMIGAAKSGTTTLFKWLKQHPDIFFPVDRKEPFYFSFADTQPEFLDKTFVESMIWKKQDYLTLYQNAPEGALLVDGSTSYLYHGTRAINNIKSFYGDQAKDLSILLILRNPIERAFSHYTYLIRNGHETLSFAEAIATETIEARKLQRWGFDYIEYGMYYEKVKAFKEAFPKIKILLFSDLKSPQATFDSICDFLQIPGYAVPKDVQANPSGIPKNMLLVNTLRKNKLLKSIHNMFPESMKDKLLIKRDNAMKRLMIKPEIDAESYQKLKGIYTPDIEKLEHFIGRDLTNWYK